MSRDTVRYTVACILLAGAAAAQHMIPPPSASPVRLPQWAAVPRQLDGWKDEDVAIDKAVADYLQAQAIFARVYRKGPWALKISAIFGTQWRSLHSPAACFFSQGWQALKREQTAIPAPENCPHPGPLHAETMVVQQGQKYVAVTYLYAYPGGTTASWVEQCYEVSRAKPGAGGIVLIVETGCPANKTDEALAAEAELVGLVYPHLVGMWYRGG